MQVKKCCQPLLIFVVLIYICLTTVQGSDYGVNNRLENNAGKIPSMARKAGGRARKLSTTTLSPPSTVEVATVEEQSYESMEDELEEVEKDCRKSNHFWHIRGKQCVPIWCQYGRNVDTGTCFPPPPLFNAFSGVRRYSYGRSHYGNPYQKGVGGFQWHHKNNQLARG